MCFRLFLFYVLSKVTIQNEKNTLIAVQNECDSTQDAINEFSGGNFLQFTGKLLSVYLSLTVMVLIFFVIPFLRSSLMWKACNHQFIRFANQGSAVYVLVLLITHLQYPKVCSLASAGCCVFACSVIKCCPHNECTLNDSQELPVVHPTKRKL